MNSQLPATEVEAGNEPAMSRGDHGPTATHWAAAWFVAGHFVVLGLFTLSSVIAIFELLVAGGFSADHCRGSLFFAISTWLLLLFGAYPLPALCFWKTFMRASISWLDILRGRGRPLSEAERGRGWLFSPWGPWILVVNCVVPIIAAIWILVWLAI